MKELKDNMSSNNIIGMETHFRGDIETSGNIRIEGRVTGNIKTKSKIALGKFALVEGNIYAQNAELSGRLKGKIYVYDTLVLKPSSVVEGQIKTNNLLIEQGASFSGTCKMKSNGKEAKLVIDEASSEQGSKTG